VQREVAIALPAVDEGSISPSQRRVLRVGDKIDTNFILWVIRDGPAREIAFGELLSRPLIVSLYMRANTPSCDRQVASLGKAAAEFRRRGYEVLAIGRDTRPKQLRYAASCGAPVWFASDPESHFARAAGAMVGKMLYGRSYVGPARAAFVFATDGVVRAVIEKVDTADHAAQLRQSLDPL
jgi:thioredoxin-dependent peroxiredoxin